MDRVLAPRGVMLSKFVSAASNLEFQQVGDWFVYRKPVPDTIDDWPMHMYEPGNNAVCRDMSVGPPKRLQWRGGPAWTRSHEFASSLNAMVSMKGKLFYVMDEGSRLSPVLPEKWTLVCRDAFNGIVLWKRSLPTWHTHWWPVKSGPTQAMRRLVALDDKLYIPLGAGAPLSELDAATGETVRTFEGTDGVEEIRVSEGTIFLLTSDAVAEQQTFNLTTVEVWNAAGNATGQFKWDDRQRTISAIDRASGQRLWTQQYPVMTVTLAIDGKRLYFHNGKRVVAVSRKTGAQLWTSEDLQLKTYKLGTATAPSLLVHDDVVICGQGFDFDEGLMLALSAETGKTLWKEVHQSSGHSSLTISTSSTGWCGTPESPGFRSKAESTGDVICTQARSNVSFHWTWNTTPGSTSDATGPGPQRDSSCPRPPVSSMSTFAANIGKRITGCEAPVCTALSRPTA